MSKRRLEEVARGERPRSDLRLRDGGPITLMLVYGPIAIVLAIGIALVVLLVAVLT